MKKAQPVTYYYLAAAISFITFAVYLTALQNGSVGWWDDNAYVFENPHIRSVNRAFFEWILFDFYSWNWHPLTWISHALDYALWGLNPLGHHLTNIILHAANTFLVVLLVTRLAEVLRGAEKNGPATFFPERSALITAGVAGLLFGLHPLHVESVAWIAERKDLLCALFFLLSLILYVKYAGGILHETARGSSFAGLLNKHYLRSFGFFILALLSKPMAVTLPAVLLILDWYPFQRIRTYRTFRTAVAEKLPFIALSLVSSILTILAQRAGGAIASMDNIPLSARLLVGAGSLVSYVRKMVLPLDLAAYYPYPGGGSLVSLSSLFAVVLVVGITILCVVIAKKRKVWLSVWSYYVITLVPVLGIVQVGGQAMADRYTYLPSLGPFLAAGLATAWISSKVNAVTRHTLPVKVACTAAAIVVFASLAYLTVEQIAIWKNSFTLWDHAIAKGFESSTAYNNRGLSYGEMGLRDQEIADLDKAIALDPRNYLAYNNRGVSYGEEGSFQKSIEYFNKAIAINPEHADSYCNLGLSYFYLGRYDRALENYDKAIELKRDFAMAYFNRGNLYFTAGSKELAGADYRKACALGNEKACAALP